MWTNFFICLFLGWLGVHKFREKKVAWGILYLFTAGLFFVGWIVDTIEYYKIASKAQDIKAETSGKFIFSKTRNLTVTVILWVLTVFLILLGIGTLPSISSVLFFVAAVIVAPVYKWQEILGNFLKGKIKSIVASVLVIASLATMPGGEAPNDDGSEDTSGDIQVTDTVLDEGDSELEAETSKRDETTEHEETVKRDEATERVETEEDTDAGTTELVTESTEQETETTELNETTELEVTTEIESESTEYEETTERETETTKREEETTKKSEETTKKPEETTKKPEETTKKPEETTKPIEDETEPPEETTGPAEESRKYVLNTNTMKFHYPSCSYVKTIEPHNYLEFYGTRDEIIDMDYEACKRCHP